MMRYIGTHSTLLASVAEGFFAISGFLLGYTSFSMVQASGWSNIIKKNILRALKLLSIGLMLTSIHYLWSLKTGSRLYLGDRNMFVDFNNLSQYLPQSFFGYYIYGYHDILFNYAVVIFFSPIFLFLAKSKKYKTALVISLILWSINYIYPGRFDINNSSFNNLGWQIIFYPPLLMGYWLKENNNKEKLKNLITSLQNNKVLYWVSMIAIFLYIFSFYYGYLEGRHYPFLNDFIATNSSRDNMGPIRVLVFYLWLLTALIFFYQKSLVTKLKNSSIGFVANLTKLVMYFGRYSLAVYVIHFLFILMFYYILRIPDFMSSFVRSKYLADDLSIIFIIIIIYYLARGLNGILSYVKKKKSYS